MSLATSYQNYLDSFYSLTSAEPETLTTVSEKIVDKCRAALALEFTTRRIVFTASPDDDTISVRCEGIPSSNSSTWRQINAKEPWKSLIGAVFGWGWITINQQGYCDGVLLSFDGLSPAIMLCVVASSIAIRRLVDAEENNIPLSKR
jgi:Family of unknown function (DUF6334)